MRFFGALLLAFLEQAQSPTEPTGLSEFVLKSDRPPFQLTLPAGYRRTVPRENPLVFDRQVGPQAWERFRVQIVPLGRTLSQDEPPPVEDLLRSLKLPEVRERAAFRFPWEGFEVDGIECRCAVEGTDSIARAVWIPASPESLSVCVFAPSTLGKELSDELRRIAGSVKGSTRWLSPREKTLLRFYNWPAVAVPVLSALFLTAWALLFRRQLMEAHLLRTLWHGAVVATAIGAFVALLKASAAREKAMVEAPHFLWFLVIVPLALFHLTMMFRRLKLGVEMSD